MRPVGALLVHCINGIEEASEHRIARQGCVKIVPWSLKDALIGKCFSCFGTFNISDLKHNRVEKFEKPEQQKLN